MATQTINIPDIGGATDVDVIEVLVAVGDTVEAEQSLVTLEGDKASMEVPSPAAGVVTAISIAVGDKVSEGSVICEMDMAASAVPAQSAKAADAKEAPTKKAVAPAPQQRAAPADRFQARTDATIPIAGSDVYASPLIRRFARELGVDLKQVKGMGQNERVTKTDVQQFVKNQLAGGGSGLPEAPKVDFSRFGEVETKPLSKIKKLSGKNLHRNWVLIPHVTQFDDADITEIEAFRKANKAKAESEGAKLTLLVFLMKAVVAALKALPQFNASLDASGENVVLKKYFHIGVAVDTPNGLVVPVIRDVDQKSPIELAKELGTISKKAREVGLTMQEMQGSCLTISSLGGIGGTAFTPIVNMPDVSILGVSRAKLTPVYNKAGELEPRLMLPLCLSYDHRVIDGADGARFTSFLVQQLADNNLMTLGE